MEAKKRSLLIMFKFGSTVLWNLFTLSATVKDRYFCVLRRFFSFNGKFFGVEKHEQRNFPKVSQVVWENVFFMLFLPFFRKFNGLTNTTKRRKINFMLMKISWRRKSFAHSAHSRTTSHFPSTALAKTFPLFPPQMLSHNILHPYFRLL